MGLDVEMFVIPEGGINEELVKWVDEVVIRSALGQGHFNDGKWLSIDERVLYEGLEEGTRVVSVNTMWRYYGDGYERGPFESIYYVYRVLRKHLGGRIFYFNDCNDWVTEVTDERMDELYEHFVNVGGSPYGKSFRDKPTEVT